MTRADTMHEQQPPAVADESSADAVEDSEGWVPGKLWRVTALAVLVLVGLGYLAEAWQLELGTAQQPDIGMYPRAAGVMFVLFLVGMLVTEVRAAPVARGAGATASAVSWLKPLAVLGAVLFYVVTAPTLGHILSGAVIMVAVLRLVGRRPWWQLAALAILCPLATYVLIAGLLEMPLPVGRFGLEF